MLRTPNGVLLEGESEEELLLQDKKIFLDVRLSALKSYQKTNDPDWVDIIKDLDENYEKTKTKVLASSPEVPSQKNELPAEKNRETGNYEPKQGVNVADIGF